MGQEYQELGSHGNSLPPLPEAVSVGGSAGIAAKLRRAIMDGAYGLNERLPAERELADLFKTSRGTIREALRRLQELGMVDRQIGSALLSPTGSFLNTPKSRMSLVLWN